MVTGVQRRRQYHRRGSNGVINGARQQQRRTVETGEAAAAASGVLTYRFCAKAGARATGILEGCSMRDRVLAIRAYQVVLQEVTQYTRTEETTASDHSSSQGEWVDCRSGGLQRECSGGLRLALSDVLRVSSVAVFGIAVLSGQVLSKQGKLDIRCCESLNIIICGNGSNVSDSGRVDAAGELGQPLVLRWSATTQIRLTRMVSAAESIMVRLVAALAPPTNRFARREQNRQRRRRPKGEANDAIGGELPVPSQLPNSRRRLFIKIQRGLQARLYTGTSAHWLVDTGTIIVESRTEKNGIIDMPESA